jgi:cytochrome c oxidase subunit II
LGLETAHSPNADDITAIYAVMLFLGTLFAVAVNAALIFCIVRFRATRGREPVRFRGQGRIQARAAAALAVAAIAIFIAGVVYTEKASDVEASGPNGLAATNSLVAQEGLSLPTGDVPDPLRIRAVGQQWIWRYEYPAPDSGSGAPESTGAQTFADVFSYYELTVPVDTTVVVDVDSTDVVHRWWVPELGGKFDATPGRVNETWFKADEEGFYDGQSAAFSGASYAVMRTRVHVVSVPEYQAWLTKQAADIQAAQASVQQQLSAKAGSTAPGPAGSEGPAKGEEK